MVERAPWPVRSMLRIEHVMLVRNWPDSLGGIEVGGTLRVGTIHATVRTAGSCAVHRIVTGTGVVARVGDPRRVTGASDLDGRVPAPSGPGRHLRALHQERVRLEPGAGLDRDAVVHESAHAQRAAGADRAASGLERAVLLGVALDDRARVERAAVADGDERALGERAAVV